MIDHCCCTWLLEVLSGGKLLGSRRRDDEIAHRVNARQRIFHAKDAILSASGDLPKSGTRILLGYDVVDVEQLPDSITVLESGKCRCSLDIERIVTFWQ
jgi:hypothetical protein